jgi:hypothetical protein
MNDRTPLKFSAIALALVAATFSSSADERRFTYSYEPETPAKGTLEFEQWVTIRSQRNKAVGQDNYNRFDLREELEYGVTDRYALSVYLSTEAESFRDPLTDDNISEFKFGGISIENRYMVLNPAENPVGLTLYLEPGFSGEEAEIEQRIIIGQRHGSWKWAFNVTHETEWEDNFDETEGVLEGSIGIAYDLNKHWSIGLEARNHVEIPEYESFEHSALFVGPVASYRQEKWWAALTVMPQVYGVHFGDENPDDSKNLVLDDHERVNVRLLIGINL